MVWIAPARRRSLLAWAPRRLWGACSGVVDLPLARGSRAARALLRLHSSACRASGAAPAWTPLRRRFGTGRAAARLVWRRPERRWHAARSRWASLARWLGRRAAARAALCTHSVCRRGLAASEGWCRRWRPGGGKSPSHADRTGTGRRLGARAPIGPPSRAPVGPLARAPLAPRLGRGSGVVGRRPSSARLPLAVRSRAACEPLSRRSRAARRSIAAHRGSADVVCPPPVKVAPRQTRCTCRRR